MSRYIFNNRRNVWALAGTFAWDGIKIPDFSFGFLETLAYWDTVSTITGFPQMSIPLILGILFPALSYESVYL